MTTLEIILSVGLLLQLASHVSTFRAAAKVSDRVLVIEQALTDPKKALEKVREKLKRQAKAAAIVRMVADPPAELRAVLARNGWERGS